MNRWIRKNWKELKAVIHPYIGRIILLIVIQLVSLLLAIGIPLLNMELINLFAYEEVGRKHLIYVIAYISFLVFTVCAGYVGGVFKRNLDLQMEKDLKSLAIDYALSKKQGDYDLNELGELDASIKVDVSVFQQFILKYLLEYPFVIARMIFIGVILCLQCYEIAIAMGLIQILIMVFRKRFDMKLEQQSVDVRTKYAGLNDVIGDIVSKISYISPLGAKPYVSHKYEGAYNDFASKALKQAKLGSGVAAVFEFLMNLNLVVVLGIGSFKIYHGSLSVGALLSIVQYMGMFLGACNGLNTYLVEMHSDSKNICNIFEIIKAGSKSNANKEEQTENNIQKLMFSNISFAYAAGKDILENADAEFEKGKLSCVVGPSGSGKSTLLKLLLGKYPLNEGEFCVVAGNQKKNLHEEYMAFVPQENVFFTDTIYNNIVLGGEYDREYVYKVCKECSIYDDICGLENGFDTIISNGLLNFSGGQIKRLSIARAIIQNKDILLIDEPTVGLDEDNVSNVIDCIEKYAKEKIVIVITHDKLLENRAEKVYSLKDRKLHFIG